MPGRPVWVLSPSPWTGHTSTCSVSMPPMPPPWWAGPPRPAEPRAPQRQGPPSNLPLRYLSRCPRAHGAQLVWLYRGATRCPHLGHPRCSRAETERGYGAAIRSRHGHAEFTMVWPECSRWAYSLDAMSTGSDHHMQRRTVVFDFDGTLALGRGPLNAYAACLGELTTPQAAAACQAAIERFDTGQTAYRDAYDAVRVAALEFAVPAEHLSTAYLRSRELLATDAARSEQ